MAMWPARCSDGFSVSIPTTQMGFGLHPGVTIKISDLGVIVKERAEIITKERLLHNKTISGTKKRLFRQKNDYATKKQLLQRKNDYKRLPGDCGIVQQSGIDQMFAGFTQKSYGKERFRGKYKENKDETTDTLFINDCVLIWSE